MFVDFDFIGRKFDDITANRKNYLFKFIRCIKFTTIMLEIERVDGLLTAPTRVDGG